jgi:hypothetical protein
VVFSVRVMAELLLKTVLVTEGVALPTVTEVLAVSATANVMNPRAPTIDSAIAITRSVPIPSLQDFITFIANDYFMGIVYHTRVIPRIVYIPAVAANVFVPV